LNTLEAFTYRGRDYLEDESFIGASTSAVRETLEKTLSAASEWMNSGGADADEKTLRSKLKELEDIVNPILKRKDESAKRPDAIKELKDTIAHLKEVEQLVDGQIKTQSAESSKSSEAVSQASASASASPSSDPMDDLEEEADPSASGPAEPEITEVVTVYTETDLTLVQDHVSKAQSWLDENEAKQSKLTETDDPAFTIKDIEAEKKRLDDLVMDMMMKRMKHLQTPPKAKSKPKSTKAKRSATKFKKSTKETDQAEQQEKPDRMLTEEELQEALKKAGIKAEDIKLKDLRDDGDMVDENGRKLKKLDIEKDASEQDILDALDEATKNAGKEKEKDEL
jgi:hypoxia up-regulated 1